MIVIVAMSGWNALPACTALGLAILAAKGVGDWGELIVFAVVVAVSLLKGIIEAAKKKREARERKRQIPLPKSSAKSSAAKRSRVEPQTLERPTARARRSIPLRPKPQPLRPAPVSKSPPTANVPTIFETLAEAIREANQGKTRRARRSGRRDLSPEVPRPPAVPQKPPKRAHQSVAKRHAIRDRETRRDASSEQRLGHLDPGVVTPPTDPYAKKTRGVHALHGVDLRQAIILKEVLGLPVALRDTDDYFSP